MLVLNDVLGYKNRKIYQDDKFFKFSLDGVLLSKFVSLKLTTKNIIDIGTGTGIIPLLLSLKTNKKIDAIEIQKELCDIFTKTIKYNKLEKQINLINDDIKLFSRKVDNLNKYDVVICNPPYFAKTKTSSVKENARHENLINLDELINSSKIILKNSGSLYLVYDSKRVIELINKLNKNNFSIKRIKFVHENIDKESSIVLIEAIKNGKTTTKILPPFILYKKNGIMTSSYEKIYLGKE